LARRFIDLLAKSDPQPTDSQPIDLTGQTTLQSLGQVLNKLSLFVSADTGVMHMAAAVGTKIVSIFGGPALAGETGPYAPGSMIVQGYAPCSPCTESHACNRRPCPALPDGQTVIQAARHILALDPQPNSDTPTHNPARRSISIPDNQQRQTGIYSRTFSVSSDDLGQTLKPAQPTWLDDQERLALTIRETAAKIFYPAHQPNLDLIKLENYLYYPKNKPASNLKSTISSIATLAYDETKPRQTFIDLAMETLKHLDSKAKRL
jgi:hypothetical protein